MMHLVLATTLIRGTVLVLDL